MKGTSTWVDPRVEARVRRKPTPLRISIEMGALDLTRLLLCDGYRTELDTDSPLNQALEHRRWDLLHLLLDWGADPAGAEDRQYAPGPADECVKLQIEPDHPAIILLDDGQRGPNDQRSTRNSSQEASPRVGRANREHQKGMPVFRRCEINRIRLARPISGVR